MNRKIIDWNYADFEPVKLIALGFPGAEEATSHENTPSIKVRGKLMCRLHENGGFIPIRLDFALRDQYLDSYPEVFHLPDHYKNYPFLCMWTNHLNKSLVKEVLEASWRGLASKKQVSEWEAGKNTAEDHEEH